MMGILKDWMHNSELELNRRTVSINKAISILKSIDKELNDSECARILRAAWSKSRREGLGVYPRVNTPPNVTTLEATEKSLEAIIRGENPYIYGESIIDDGNNRTRKQIEFGALVLFWNTDSFLIMMHHYGLDLWNYAEVWEEHPSHMNTLLMDMMKASEENDFDRPNEFFWDGVMSIQDVPTYRTILGELYDLMSADALAESTESDTETILNTHGLADNKDEISTRDEQENTDRNSTVESTEAEDKIKALEAKVKALETYKSALEAKVSELETKALESHQASQNGDNTVTFIEATPYIKLVAEVQERFYHPDRLDKDDSDTYAGMDKIIRELRKNPQVASDNHAKAIDIIARTINRDRSKKRS